MEPDQAAPLTTGEQIIFKDARHHFLRVNGQAPSRLTVSTFLTGLTFASFAALLAALPLTPAKGAGLSADQVLVAISRTLMSIAALLFLLTAASTFAALQLLANVSPTAAKALSEGTPRNLDPRDAERLRRAHEIYMTPSNWIPWGLVLLMLSLPVIGWRSHPVIGAITVFMLIVLGLQLLPLIRVAIEGIRHVGATVAEVEAHYER